jgi:acetate---CoA ligase (ADP-forming)
MKGHLPMDLTPLMNPGAIALIGVSKDPSRIGGRVLKYLRSHGYEGKIFLVNPKYEELEGIRCYPSLASIPSPVDVALVGVPEQAVPSVLEEAGRAKVKSAIIYSAGFSELGAGGKLKQSRIKEISEQYGMPVCGPNCVGIVGFHNKAAMSFSQFLDVPELIPGHIAFISQSGALGGAILNRIQDIHIGISSFVSTGNEAVLEASDFMEYFLDDPDTSVIMALMEGIRDGKKFMQVAQRAKDKAKPIIVLKIGRTETGSKAASSHTGSMTGSDAVYEAIFRQYGVIRVGEIEDLYLTASAFSKGRFPKGNRVGILTTTGGGGVILTDQLVEMGMTVPDLTPETMSNLAGAAPSFGIVKNPLDLTAQVINDPFLFPRSMEIFIKDENLDAVIVSIAMVAGGKSKERASYIVETAKLTEKPVLSWWAAGSLSRPGTELIQQSDVPLFASPERCARTLHSLVKYSARLKAGEEKGKSSAPHLKKKRLQLNEMLPSSGVLTEDKGKEILSAYGIPVTRETLSKDFEQAKANAQRIGFPVALKVISPQIKHKTEAGGLTLNIRDEVELLAAYDRIMRNVSTYDPKAQIQGLLVQEMVPPGKEIIFGAKHDPQFGPMVMFGLGGIHVEVMKDFSLRHAPMTEKDASEMIREIKGYKLLEGVRGDKPVDFQAIMNALLAFSELLSDFEDVFLEIDINPLLVYEHSKGLKAVDCLFITNPNYNG